MLDRGEVFVFRFVVVIIIIIGLSGSAPYSCRVEARTKPGCRARCGQLEISYPFGTLDGGTDCYYVDGEISDQFVVYCNDSFNPPMPYFDSGGNLPIVDISVENHEMRIMMFVARDCYSSDGKRMSRNSPWATLGTFRLSIVKNRFEHVCLLNKVLKLNFPNGRAEINNYTSAPNGRIWLFSRKDIQIRPLYSSDQVIHCEIEVPTHPAPIFLTFVYGSNSQIERRRLWFTVVGCDTYAYFTGREDNVFSTGCMSLCSNINDVTNGSCSGVGCCQTSFPRNMMAFNISLLSWYNHSFVHDFNPCGFAFVAANDYFNFSTASLKNISEEKMPLFLDWAIGNQTCEVARQNINNDYMCKENTNCTNADNGAGYHCHCKEGYQGNPYLSGPDGCQDIDECETSSPCNGGICTNLPGTYNCSCPMGTEGDPLKHGCSPIRKKSMSRDIALGVTIGFFVLMSGASWLILGLRQRKMAEERKNFYRSNGGLMLERVLSQHTSYVETLKVFSADDLKKATDNYDESRILGEGGQGTVYKGTMMNNKIVAIKKAKMLDRSQVDEFINEVIVLSQINHRNVVKLLGCCLETELPLLVYEFVTNGTLFEHLHGDGQDSTLSSWRARLRVAVETAVALSYLHTDASIPIIHRDVKSTNILLDENYTAKVSDFGASRLMPSDQAQLSTLVQGTLGYLDPEYFHSSQLTDKSDVYSFGVVLAELLTGMKAISFNRPERERNLSLYFIMAVKEDRYLEIIDKRILNEGNAEQIKEVAQLASKCMKIKGDDRPSMREVALELEGLLRATDAHPWRHQDSDNLQENEYLLGDFDIGHSKNEEIGTLSYDDTNRLVPFNIEDGR